MTKIYLLCLFSFFLLTTAQGQLISEPIQMLSNKFKFKQKGNFLTIAQTKSALQVNPASYQQFNKAAASHGWGLVFTGVSGGLIGLTLIKVSQTRNLDTGLIFPAAGATIVAALLMSSGTKNARAAIKSYNSSLPKTAYQSPYTLQVGLTSNGVGVSVGF